MIAHRFEDQSIVRSDRETAEHPHALEEDAVYVPAFAAESVADKIALVARTGAALSVECTKVTADGAVMTPDMLARFTELVPQLRAAVAARAELAELQPEIYEAGHYVWRQRHAGRWR